MSRLWLERPRIAADVIVTLSLCPTGMKEERFLHNECSLGRWKVPFGDEGSLLDLQLYYIALFGVYGCSACICVSEQLTLLMPEG